MGFRIKAVPLELPGYQEEENPDDNLVVHALLPSVVEGETVNAGRIQVPDKENEGKTREETQTEFQRRVFAIMVPKLRSWNLEEEDGTPIPVPRDIHPGDIGAQLAHLYQQDENAVLAIWQAWRIAGLPRKKGSEEGKDSETTSTPGPDASPRSAHSWDMRELEAQIPQ